MPVCQQCDKKSVAKGLCNSHYKKMRWRTDADFRARHMASKCSQAGVKFTGFSAELLAFLQNHQAGLCAICAVRMEPSGRWSAARQARDHCHASGEARGLLCTACNTSLGFYEKFQRQAGLRLEPYENYLAHPPAKLYGWPLSEKS